MNSLHHKNRSQKITLRPAPVNNLEYVKVPVSRSSINVDRTIAENELRAANRARDIAQADNRKLQTQLSNTVYEQNVMYTEILKCIPDEYIAQHSFSIPAVVKLFQELSKDYVKQ